MANARPKRPQRAHPWRSSNHAIVQEARRRPRHHEDGEAMALMGWAGMTFYQGKTVAEYLVHIPNGGKRNAREAGRLRRMGVKAGYPDYLLDIMRPRRGSSTPYGGMRIELKARPEQLGRRPQATDLQLEHISRLTIAGYHSVVAHGWTDAAMLICEYLDITPNVPCNSPR